MTAEKSERTEAPAACPKCGLTYGRGTDFCGIDGERLVRKIDDPLIGRTIDRYRVIEHLGSGAMARVYRARHVHLDHEYALKVLVGPIASDRMLAERFRREALAASRIKHPNVVSVIDYGSTPEGVTFSAMELLRGRTLGELIAQHGALNPERAVSIARDIASALAAAHALGFVHRDLKPGNVMLVQTDEGERAKVLDFGLVRLQEGAEDDVAPLTRAGQIHGTPMYMSPEQIEASSGVGPRSDLYSLGILLYEMLTGRPPFFGGVHLVLAKQLKDLPAPIPEHGAPGALALSLLEKDPAKRPPSAAHVVASIDAMTNRNVRVSLLPTAAVSEPAPPAPPAEEVQHKSRRRARATLVAAAVALPAVLSAGVWLARGLSVEQPSASTPRATSNHVSGAARLAPGTAPSPAPAATPTPAPVAAPSPQASQDSVHGSEVTVSKPPPAGSSPAKSSPAGSSPTGSSPAGSSPAGSSPAGSSPAGSSPAGSSPAPSSPAPVKAASVVSRPGDRVKPLEFDAADRELRAALKSRGITFADLETLEPEAAPLWRKWRSLSYPPPAAAIAATHSRLLTTALGAKIDGVILGRKLDRLRSALSDAARARKAGVAELDRAYHSLRSDVARARSAKELDRLALELSALEQRVVKLR